MNPSSDSGQRITRLDKFHPYALLKSVAPSQTPPGRRPPGSKESWDDQRDQRECPKSLVVQQTMSLVDCAMFDTPYVPCENTPRCSTRHVPRHTLLIMSLE